MSAGGLRPPVSLLEHAAKFERWVVLAALTVAAAAGLYVTLWLGDAMMIVDPDEASYASYAALLFLMWWSMMMAMMLPSAAPAILCFAAIRKKFDNNNTKPVTLLAFVAGYLSLWGGFSVAAVTLQLVARPYLAMSMMMATTNTVIGGGLLVLAGLYQLSPLKTACLSKCQTPLFYLARNWREGRMGAFKLGLSHGLYCLGCCWVLMALLFYGGVMELRWIVGLAIYVAAEKLLPLGSNLARIAGLILVGWGAWSIYLVA